MKKTLIALAAATTVSLGAMGAASAAPNAGLDVTAQNGAGIQKVHHFHYHRYRRYRYCRRLYYKGFVLGWRWARYRYYRHCRRYY